MKKLNKRITDCTFYIGEVTNHCPCMGLPEEAYEATGGGTIHPEDKMY
ncbi:hypothetical protein PV797_11700 [Clostridiaceae bacterium M8S5]|nr:hypothetical protein PV797_11700 [Clostridiaceae bacterium M8S5]